MITPKPENELNIEDLLGHESYQEAIIDGEVQFLPPVTKNLLYLSTNGEGRETPIEKQHESIMLKQLLEVLTSNQPLTYQELSNIASNKFDNLGENIKRTLFPKDSDLRNDYFFTFEAAHTNGLSQKQDFKTTWCYYSLQLEAWKIDLGAIQGLEAGFSIRSTSGELFSVVAVYPNHSLVAMDEDRDKSKFIQVIVSPIIKYNLSILFDNKISTPFSNTLMKRLSRIRGISIGTEKEDCQYEFKEDYRADSIFLNIYKKSSSRKIATFDSEDITIINRFVESIKNWENLFQLTNPETRLEQDIINIELFETTELGDYSDDVAVKRLEWSKGNVLELTYQQKEDGEWFAPAIQVKLTGNSDESYYVSALVLEEDYTITNKFLPYAEINQEFSATWLSEIIDNFPMRTLPIHMNLKENARSEETVLLKFIITNDEQLSTDFFSTEGMDLSAFRPTKSRFGVFLRKSINDWMVIDLPIRVVHPALVFKNELVNLLDEDKFKNSLEKLHTNISEDSKDYNQLIVLRSQVSNLNYDFLEIKVISTKEYQKEVNKIKDKYRKLIKNIPLNDLILFKKNIEKSEFELIKINLKKSLIEGSIKEVLNNLEKHISIASPIHDNFIQISNNFYQLKSQIEQGIISRNYEEYARNQVFLKIVSLIDELDEKNFEISQAQLNSNEIEGKTKQPYLLKTDIKRLLSKGKTIEALDKIKEISPKKSPLYDSYIQTHHKYEYILRSQAEGIISQKEAGKANNEIISEIISLINNFQQKDIEISSKKTKLSKIESFQSKLEELLIRNKIDEVIHEIKNNLSKNFSLHKSLDEIIKEYDNLEYKKNMRVFTKSEEILTFNKIVSNIIILINRLNQENINTSIRKSSIDQKERKKSEIEIKKEELLKFIGYNEIRGLFQKLNHYISPLTMEYNILNNLKANLNLVQAETLKLSYEEKEVNSNNIRKISINLINKLDSAPPPSNHNTSLDKIKEKSKNKLILSIEDSLEILKKQLKNNSPKIKIISELKIQNSKVNNEYDKSIEEDKFTKYTINLSKIRFEIFKLIDSLEESDLF